MFWVWGSGGLNLLVSSRKRQCNGAALTDNHIIKYNRYVFVLAWTRRVMEVLRTTVIVVGSGFLTLTLFGLFIRILFNAVDDWTHNEFD